MKDYQKKFLVTPEVQKERLDICKECVHRRKAVCAKCGCLLHLKTRLKGTECPVGKW